ncbi:PAS domain-containing hybrid sensor histidine kinase/response regulator [Alteromonas sp. BMJM2]|uniref:PAS domain-containing hybrid sensor histidine kinase/response regulator n=1 Tax=Alteromonas sp. BMJM2 TaxID=2954241 RepID=UPI0022B4755B|nr:PAS domain-containing hybrid sensor histidine kinase/response regulator [Alteromonas sp. BMJM2]
MLSIWSVGSIVAVYLFILFAIGFWGERYLKDNRQHPILYSLGLGVHCTSWAFFGTTSQAAEYGWAIVPTYMGIIATMIFAFPVILHISRLCQQHNITSLADLIGLRYKHSHLVAAFVSVLCFVGVIPYIALQLDAITKSITLITPNTAEASQSVSMYVALLMAIFAIIFGTRTLNLTDKHPGLLMTIAFESVFKLVALWCIGIFVCYFMFDGVLDLISKASINKQAREVIYSDSAPLVYVTHVMLGVCSMFVLPRQFHMNFVELNGEGELRTARWFFPIYLLGMTVFLIPLALAGKMLLPESVSSDTYVLALPLFAENTLFSIIAFLGGLSATTSMVIVATLALGIMIANNLVTPLWIKARLRTEPNHTLETNKVLVIRRLTVLVVLSVALWYHLNVSQAAPLVKSGVIAIALLGQCFPVLMFGLYWKKSTKAAALAGLFSGFLCWSALLLYPSVMSSYYFNPPPTDAQLGIGFIISLITNAAVYILVSLVSKLGLINNHAGELSNSIETSLSTPYLKIRVGDIMSLTSRVLDKKSHDTLINQLSIDVSDASANGLANHTLLQRVEQLLAAQVGGPSARILLGAIADKNTDSLPELVDWVEEASQSFQFNHEVLQSSVQNIEQGISVLDEKLQLLAWNERYVELFRYPRGFLKVGMSIHDILSFNAKRGLFGKHELKTDASKTRTLTTKDSATAVNSDRETDNTDGAALHNHIDKEIEKRIHFMREGSRHKYIRKQHDGRVIELNGAPLPGGGYVTTYSDITEYIAIQDELKESKSKLEQRVMRRTKELQLAKQQADAANESKTKFLAAAGHDLMQPFNAATLFASMLEKKTKNSELSDLSEGVVNSLNNAQTLLSMLLDMTKLDTGVLKPDKATFAIDDVLSSLVAEFSLIASQRGISLKYVKTKCYTHTDKHLFRRVIQNLLSNAIRYTQDGSVLVGVRKCKSNNKAALNVCVYDTGPGIEPHQQEEIFGEFNQLENPNSSQGIGLGLTIVDRICKLLGHSVSLKSALHKGSCFAINVPKCAYTSHNKRKVDRQGILSFNDEEPNITTAGIPNDAQSRTPKEDKHSLFLVNTRILLIENDEQVAVAMQALLSDWGAEVIVATGKKDAIDAYYQKPDVVIADYHLNFGETGTDILQSMDVMLAESTPLSKSSKPLKSDTPVLRILITANRSPEIRELAGEMDLAYLPKPVKPSALKRLLKQTFS